MPKLSVIITTYQREWHLDLCLAALAAQSRQPDEVIVVDDGGEDDALLVVRERLKSCTPKCPLFYVWHTKRGWGLSRSRNEGARLATGELLVLIDVDILLKPGALAAYDALYAECPDRAIGGYYQYLPFFPELQPEMVIERWEDIWYHCLPAAPMEQSCTILGMDVREAYFAQGRIGEDVFKYEHKPLWQPHLLLGGNMMIPRHIFDQTGGFDEGFTTYGGEDAMMSLRIIDAGYPISYSKAAGGAHLAHAKHPDATGPGEYAALRYIASQMPAWFHDTEGRDPIFAHPGWQHPKGVNMYKTWEEGGG